VSRSNHLPNSIERFEEMPEGWRFDKTWGSPDHGWVPICNGKSLLNGGRKGLLKWSPPVSFDCGSQHSAVVFASQVQPKQELSANEIRVVAEVTNQLAREKFKERLLQDLAMDLTICKIEGWPISEYVTELKNLIDQVHESVTGLHL